MAENDDNFYLGEEPKRTNETWSMSINIKLVSRNSELLHCTQRNNLSLDLKTFTKYKIK